MSKKEDITKGPKRSTTHGLAAKTISQYILMSKLNMLLQFT